jgi:hypothetical protein
VLDVSLTEPEIADLIKDLCDAAAESDPDSFAAQVAALSDVQTAAHALDVIEGVGSGAEVYCPETVEDESSFLNDAYALAAPLVAPATTIPPTTTTTAAPATTRPPVVTAPPQTQPPATQPPATQPSRGAYANCTEARNAGAAPVYRGDPGYGSHLDRDNDGVGCE